MKISNKFLITLGIEILFTMFLVLLLISVRQKSINYLYDIQDYSEELNTIQQDLETQNLTSYNQENITVTLDTVNKILDKALFLLKILLPISLILLSLIFYYLIWRFTSNISIKNYLIYSTVPLLLFFTFCYYLLNYIAYRYYFIEESPLIKLIIAAILLIITYYFALFGLVRQKSLKDTFNSAINNIKPILTPFIFNLITNAIYLVLVFILFFLLFVDGPIIVPSIALLMLLIFISLQRRNLVKNISRLY